MEDFIAILPILLFYILSGEAGSEVTTPCPCGSNLPHLFQCNDCFKYQTSCETCFICNHINNPFHWARVWQPEEGLYHKMDISCLDSNQYTILLCPYGSVCKEPDPTPYKMTVVHTNGVHAIRIRHCYCDGSPDYMKQCMMARLFPATPKNPRTLMMFCVLDEYHEHNLSSKLSAYDYVGALHRLTDGAFTAEVPDPYKQFLLAGHIWRRLCLDKHTGQAFSMSEEFPHCMPGSLVLYCPSCPKDGFNMERGWEKTPEELKHIYQKQLTADGNFHVNEYEKNNDPNDISLETANGIGYFPHQADFDEYLKTIPEVEEKSTCNYLNIVNNQNKKKFKNMRYSGVVNIACSHIIISSSVNLRKGEGFAYTDYSLKHALSHTRHKHDHNHYGTADFMLSYDCNCQYCVNLPKRFQTNFPDFVHIINRMRCSILAMHIEDHKDSCKYNFNTAYIPGAGHFHGEMAEMPWVEMNQLGGAVRQMNSGHRIGVVTAHYTYWNWLKIVKMHITHVTGYKQALQLFKLNGRSSYRLPFHIMNAFMAGCKRQTKQSAYQTKVKMKRRKFWRSRRCRQKGIGQLRKSTSQHTLFNKVSLSNICSLLLVLSTSELILIYLFSREQICGRLTLNQTETVQKEIQSQRTKLADQITTFREIQVVVMPSVEDLVSSLASGEVEKEKLYLPSDIPSSDQDTFIPPSDPKVCQGLTLVDIEAKLQEGELYDGMKAVQKAAKAYSITHTQKMENERGTNAGLRSTLQLKRIEVERDCCIADYNRARQALIALGCATSEELPIMVVSDTVRRSTFQPRKLGDSRRTDGQLYSTTFTTEDNMIEDDEGGVLQEAASMAGTRSNRQAQGMYYVLGEYPAFLTCFQVSASPTRTGKAKAKRRIPKTDGFGLQD
ncbi:hypothetical protein BT96DRAFT_822298 [Gymnopus androsaceus JB14]|uniref:CxC2-like cysteine cluster KDZ transposase-associated domain-containing protein n=1 Tax=Gymnopus androsaceus JB14 TaxID=1447944 RepID=A0A6A4HHI6_9AGAR|nr:hypothetical protein BT96DRAFT_822298 [Gymnopus androsaceus JB14]